MQKKKVLGKGLSALIPSVPEAAGQAVENMFEAGENIGNGQESPEQQGSVKKTDENKTEKAAQSEKTGKSAGDSKVLFFNPKTGRYEETKTEEIEKFDSREMPVVSGRRESIAVKPPEKPAPAQNKSPYDNLRKSSVMPIPQARKEPSSLSVMTSAPPARPDSSRVTETMRSYDEERIKTFIRREFDNQMKTLAGVIQVEINKIRQIEQKFADEDDLINRVLQASGFKKQMNEVLKRFETDIQNINRKISAISNLEALIDKMAGRIKSEIKDELDRDFSEMAKIVADFSKRVIEREKQIGEQEKEIVHLREMIISLRQAANAEIPSIKRSFPTKPLK